MSNQNPNFQSQRVTPPQQGYTPRQGYVPQQGVSSSVSSSNGTTDHYQNNNKPKNRVGCWASIATIVTVLAGTIAIIQFTSGAQQLKCLFSSCDTSTHTPSISLPSNIVGTWVASSNLYITEGVRYCAVLQIVSQQESTITRAIMTSDNCNSYNTNSYNYNNHNDTVAPYNANISNGLTGFQLVGTLSNGVLNLQEDPQYPTSGGCNIQGQLVDAQHFIAKVVGCNSFAIDSVKFALQ